MKLKNFFDTHAFFHSPFRSLLLAEGRVRTLLKWAPVLVIERSIAAN